ncbi:MAG: hypothetical protein M5R40_04780 [Anaerolineae bacterium]|nr:hypothetical protein [Anaerolineae bacterium]
MILGALAAACAPTLVVERIPQTVVVTPRVPEVTRRVTVAVTVPVTVVVTRVARETVIVTATPIPPPDAAMGDAAASQAAMRWLVGRQRNDGGFGNIRDTAWTVMALAAAGVELEDVPSRTGRTPVDYLDDVALSGSASGVEMAGLVALAFAAAGREPPGALDIAGLPVPANWPALPLLAMARGADAPAALVDALAGAQAENGGFGDVRNTAWAVLALTAVNADAPVAGALAYLRAQQRAEDAWPASETGEPDALTTALALQALVAAGEKPGRMGRPIARAAGVPAGQRQLRRQRREHRSGGDRHPAGARGGRRRVSGATQPQRSPAPGSRPRPPLQP